MEAGEPVRSVGGIRYHERRLRSVYGPDHPPLFLVGNRVVDERLRRLPRVPEDRPVDCAGLDALLAAEARRPDEGIRTVRDLARWELFLDLTASSPFEHLLVVGEADGGGSPTRSGRSAASSRC